VNIKKNIPNAITCCNLLCGCIAIVQAFEGRLDWAAYLVGMAALFDFFDGFAARILKVSSPIGKDLDSLADMVTFGLVPGIVMFLLLRATPVPMPTNGMYVGTGYHSPFELTAYVAFLIPVFSAIRLAKFNNDSRQSDSFIGVPTPANAIFICSLALLIMRDTMSYQFTSDMSSVQNMHDSPRLFALKPSLSYILIGITILFSILLVSEIPLFALKFKHFKWKGNEIRFIFLGCCALLLASLQLVGIPLCIVLYILLSVINNFITKRQRPVSG
jgi:CDP-diacylglycerol---serine O-phosphatidyltransferase